MRLHVALLELARLRGKPGNEKRGYRLVMLAYDTLIIDRAFREFAAAAAG